MPENQRPAYAIAIHGGAGAIPRNEMSPEKEKAYTLALNEALSIGENILKNGGTSLDAVEKTIMYLEDCPLFNAGKGAVFTHDGKNELDASIMDGATLKAGAVGGVTIVKNPIRAARAVMDHSEHVLMTGAGANQFAIEQGLDTVPPAYFFTQERWDGLQKALEEDKAKKATQEEIQKKIDKKFGTVGVVALDKNGNLAAGTSTGGMTDKRYNRLGDSPIIGAGTYADNHSCAISCTGHGEFFIRYGVAKDVCDLVAYKGMPSGEAADFVINDKLKKAGAEGGLICVDKFGNISQPFNSEGMYRGYAKPGERKVMIYR